MPVLTTQSSVTSTDTQDFSCLCTIYECHLGRVGILMWQANINVIICCSLCYVNLTLADLA